MRRREAHQYATEADLERLLMQAGATSINWQLEPYREHAGQEARHCYIPGPERMGMGRFLAAVALRQAMSSLSRLTSDAAREHVATAMRELVLVVRAEPAAPEPPRPVAYGRNWWTDRE